MSLPIALQLYTLRRLDLTLDETLAKVAEIGYTGVETLGDHGLSADDMNALMAKHGLKIASTHVALEALESNIDQVIEFNLAVGNEAITIPYLAEELRAKDSNGWLTIGRRLDVLGQQCTAAGLKLLYHNHGFEMEEIEGQLAIDWLMEGADPANVGFEPDLAWIAHGGVDGVELLQRYAGRCHRIHCKDLAPEGENLDQMGLADVGYGILDWSALLPAARAAGGKWYIVEHDLPADEWGSVTRSFEFLQGMLGSA